MHVSVFSLTNFSFLIAGNVARGLIIVQTNYVFFITIKQKNGKSNRKWLHVM